MLHVPDLIQLPLIQKDAFRISSSRNLPMCSSEMVESLKLLKNGCHSTAAFCTICFSFMSIKIRIEQ